MKNLIEQIEKDALSYVINDEESLEQFRIIFLSRNGKISQLFEEFKKIPSTEKKEIGHLLNIAKNTIQNRYNHFKKIYLEQTQTKTVELNIDITLPSNLSFIGSRHPISIVNEKIICIFQGLGFSIETGPEIEDDWHNFTALNFPPDHPAREMQDTFFLNQNSQILLRTHTSSVQIRVMETRKPPIRSIFPGRVYRNEVITARSHCFFHQIEGLYIDRMVSFADLKFTLLYFAKHLFGYNTSIRLRPSYFPFTEPSAELDISCKLCNGKGCQFCKYTGWVEILGCGMVDPNVLQNCNIDTDEFNGFAFGLGVERIANLLFQVKDIRLFSENDIRFLEQFRSVVV